MKLERIDIPPERSAYEKTLFYHILRYLKEPVFSYREADWQELCRFYSLDFSLIQPYLSGDLADSSVPLVYEGKRILETDWEDLAPGADPAQFLCHPNSWVLRYQSVIPDLFHCLFARAGLEEIRMDGSWESLRENIACYQDIAYHVSALSSDICVRECLEKGGYTDRNIPQITGCRSVQAAGRMLQCILVRKGERDQKILPSLYRAYRYSTLRTLDMLLLILGLQAVKFSPFFDGNGRDFCDALLGTMLRLLRDTRVLAVFKNDIYFDPQKEAEDRGRKDHTTRLQILYEYDNGDQYSLRLDMAHKGVPFFHLNSLSKGKVACFPLDEAAYRQVTEKNPAWGDLFIGYRNGLYFLRDRARRLVEKPEPGYEALAALLKKREHFLVGSQTPEPAVRELLAAWCGLLHGAADSMPPSEEVDPAACYRLSKAYELLEACCYGEMQCGPAVREALRESILRFLRESRMLGGEELEEYAGIGVMELLDYAIKKDPGFRTG